MTAEEELRQIKLQIAAAKKEKLELELKEAKDMIKLLSTEEEVEHKTPAQRVRHIKKGRGGWQDVVADNSLGITDRGVLKDVFLHLYSELANVTLTCQKMGLERRTVYQWINTDPEFKTKYQEADQMALGVLEDEAHRRAIEGTLKPVYQGGKLVGSVREYSDTLTIVLLKARAPHKYKERFAGELTGADGKPLVGDFKIVHVHSQIPLAKSEQEITDIEEVQEPIPIQSQPLQQPINEAAAPETPPVQQPPFTTSTTEDEL